MLTKRIIQAMLSFSLLLVPFQVDASSIEVKAKQQTKKEETIRKPFRAQGSMVKIAPMVGEQPVLVVLVEFKNQKLTSTTQDWVKRYFSTTTPSLSHYYNDASGGKLKLVPAQETSGTANDGVITVKLTKNHPNLGGNLDNSEQIAKSLYESIDPMVSFDKFDKNKDGKLSPSELHITFVLAGYDAAVSDESKTPSVWAHQYDLSDNPLTQDDVTTGTNGYMMVGERADNELLDLGTITHEFGHSLGLPDMYNTEDSEDFGPGIHTLMSTGADGRATSSESTGTSPVYLDPWSRIKLGWITPQEITPGAAEQVVSLFTHTTGKYNIVKVKTPKSGEYFLIENRGLNGYDAGLREEVSEGGIAIWHIDESKLNNSNTINNDPNHRAVDIVIADSEEYPYYNANGKATFNSKTKPSSLLYTKASSNVSLSVLSPAGESMKVSITGENGSTKSEEVKTLSVNSVSDRDTVVSGKTSIKNGYVEVYDENNDEYYYDGVTDANGNFSVAINKYKAGTQLVVAVYVDEESDDSIVKVVTVLDKTPPTVQNLSLVKGVLRGKTEAKATVYVTANGKTVKVVASAQGTFAVKVTGKSATVFAIDANKNRSKTFTVKGK